MKFSFVILHYLVERDTAECIQSILDQKFSEYYSIVVVDNHSANGSFEGLKAQFGAYEQIHWLENEMNLGFARGNNVGFRYAKESLTADFIIMINNDTLIKQQDFLSVLKKLYETRRFDILGPDILSVDLKNHQNPVRLSPMTLANVSRKIRSNRRELFLIQSRLIRLVTALSRLKNHNPRRSSANGAQLYRDIGHSDKELINPVLHGSALIFSPDYVHHYLGLYPGTFMYYEEEILHWLSNQLGLTILYSPQLKIIHKEDAATKAAIKKTQKKTLFKLQHELRSLYHYRAMQRNPEAFLPSLQDPDWHPPRQLKDF